MTTEEPSSEDQHLENGENKRQVSTGAPEQAQPELASDPTDSAGASSLEASFWDPSQIQKVVRHAGATGRSPEEFFNKKWKDRHIHGKKDENESQTSDEGDGGDDDSRSSQR